MYTLSDAEWLMNKRKREIYQASEARWTMEGVTVLSSQNSDGWLGKLKKLFIRLKPSPTISEPLPIQTNSEVLTQSE